MDKEKVLEFLNSLGKEKTRNYEIEITNFAVNHNSEECKDILIDIIENYNEDRVCYNAYYCFHVMCRRTKDYPRLLSVIEKYKDRFKKHITHDHLMALYYIESESIYNYEEILNTTYKDSELFDDNAGFIHLFADVFASIYEKGGIVNPERYIKTWYGCALDAVNKAIELDSSYAKYYCTKARLLAIVNNYEQAEYNINCAIALEDARRNDYLFRLSTYQHYKTIIKVEQKIFELKQSLLYRENVKITSNAEKTEATPYMGEKPFVFVSYAHYDSESVYRILQLLQDKGVRLWYDKGIPANVDYTEYIAQKIIDCDNVIFMVSQKSVAQEYVRMEIRTAIENKKTPICVFIEDTTMSPGMQMQLGGYQHIHQYTINDEEFLDKILPSLNKNVFES